MKYNFFLLIPTVFGRFFFMDPVPDVWPSRFRTQKKSQTQIRKKTRIRNTDITAPEEIKSGESLNGEFPPPPTTPPASNTGTVPDIHE